MRTHTTKANKWQGDLPQRRREAGRERRGELLNPLRARPASLRLCGKSPCLAAILAILMFAGAAHAQDAAKTAMTVQVLDQQGGAIQGARATIVDGAGKEQSGTTNETGTVAFPDLSSGSYALKVGAENFESYQD